jgi:hypothetical protein
VVSTTEGILNMDKAHPPADDEEPLLLDIVYVEEEQDPKPRSLPNNVARGVGIIGAIVVIAVFALFGR